MHNEEILYQDYLTEWFKGKRYVATQTWKVSESLIRTHVIPSLGGLALSQLNPMVLQQFVNQLKDRGLANTSVRRTFSIVHSSLEMGEKMQLIPKNPASLVHIPKKHR